MVNIPLGSMPRVGMAWRSVHEGGPQGAPVRLAFTVERYWGVHLYRYRAPVKIAGVKQQIEPGMAGFTPPGTRMEYEFRGRCEHVFAHIEWPTPIVEPESIPLLFSVGTEFPLLWERLEDVGRWWQSDPLRASVRVWDVLLALGKLARQGPEPPESRLLDRAFAVMDHRMAEIIGAAEIADELGISTGQLARIFRAGGHPTPSAALRQRRVERARHLLVETTVSVKQIASEVGIHDLHYFNKQIRTAFGASPTQVRRGPNPALRER